MACAHSLPNGGHRRLVEKLTPAAFKPARVNVPQKILEPTTRDAEFGRSLIHCQRASHRLASSRSTSAWHGPAPHQHARFLPRNSSRPPHRCRDRNRSTASSPVKGFPHLLGRATLTASSPLVARDRA